MKHIRQYRLLALFFVWILSLTNSSLASAQEGYALLITLSVLHASPGATIEITGSHFEPDALVTFALFREGKQTHLGTFFADDHGDFETSVLLPYDLPFGEYEFRGVDEKGDFAAVPLIIVPDPNREDGAEPREEEDALLAPMPTYPPDYAPTEMNIKETSPDLGFPWTPVLIASSVLVVLILAIAIGRRRSLG